MTENCWFSRNLGDAMLAGPAVDELEDRFRTAWEQAGRPDEAAVFIRHESEGQLHCDVIAWFSPAAKDIAIRLGGHADLEPSPHGLSLLAGSARGKGLLYHEREPGD